MYNIWITSIIHYCANIFFKKLFCLMPEDIKIWAPHSMHFTLIIFSIWLLKVKEFLHMPLYSFSVRLTAGDKSTASSLYKWCRTDLLTAGVIRPDFSKTVFLIGIYWMEVGDLLFHTFNEWLASLKRSGMSLAEVCKAKCILLILQPEVHETRTTGTFMQSLLKLINWVDLPASSIGGEQILQIENQYRLLQRQWIYTSFEGHKRCGVTYMLHWHGVANITNWLVWGVHISHIQAFCWQSVRILG